MYLESHKINTISWQEISPDLSHIENLWGILANRIYANNKRFSFLSELKKEIVYCWNLISNEVIQNLIKSMPQRLLEVAIAKGGHTNY